MAQLVQRSQLKWSHSGLLVKKLSLAEGDIHLLIIGFIVWKLRVAGTATEPLSCNWQTSCGN